jgi:hypothetical protein
MKAGDKYKGELVKSVRKTFGRFLPTRSSYNNGKPIQNTDLVLRIVLTTGFIHYLKLNVYEH